MKPPRKKRIGKNHSPGKTSLSYEQVKQLSLEYRLPSKIIYQLNSEFSILQTILKASKSSSTLDNDLPIKEGIPARDAYGLITELKNTNEPSAKRILAAMDLPPESKTTVIGWRDYLKLMTVVKYFTAPK